MSTAAPSPTYLRSAGLALVALMLGFATFIIRLSNEDSNLAFWFGVIIFLLVLPAIHVVGMILATKGIGRGFSRFRGFLCLLLHVVVVGLGVLFGAAALIGASA